VRILDLFSGIGGFSLAASWVWGDDLEIVAFCEIDPFCQKVLSKHWPEVPIIEDIKKVEWVVVDTERMRCGGGTNPSEERWARMVSREQRRGSVGGETERCLMECGRIDLLTGGFPCQPFSCVGKRAGTEDDRFLWPEMLRTIHEVKPRWIVAENVPGLLSQQDGLVFEGVCTDLETEGYEVQPIIVPACAVGAPHRRMRVWIVAHTRCLGPKEYEQQATGIEQSDCHAADTKSEQTLPSEPGRLHAEPCGEDRDVEIPRCERLEESKIFQPNQSCRSDKIRQTRAEGCWQEHWYEVATRLCRVDDGVPRRVDRLKSLGNAIVPQVVEQIFRAIKEVEGK